MLTPADPNAPVLVVGEVLWDALPRGLFLGGAPFNVASHLHTLGLPARFAARVGADRLGREVRRRMRTRGLPDDLLQTDAAHETGFVEVALDADGVPSYTIVEPVAWDHLAWTDALAEAAAGARAVVFGSLAQRHAGSRATLERLLQTAAPKVFDVNLRPPFVDRAVVEASLAAAHVAKLNEDELDVLRRWYGLPAGDEAAAEATLDRFGLTTLCVTRGPDGALLWHDGGYWRHPGYRTPVADTVGAGDAFLAMLLAALLAGADGATALDRANRLGAFVASQEGATPAYDLDTLASAALERA